MERRPPTPQFTLNRERGVPSFQPPFWKLPDYSAWEERGAPAGSVLVQGARAHLRLKRASGFVLGSAGHVPTRRRGRE